MTNSLTDGVVTINLDGQSIDLKATPNAALKISRTYGGIMPVYQKVNSLDIDAMNNIIRYASDSDEDFVPKIFKTGIADLLVPLSDYMNLLANGGKKDTEEPKKKARAKA